MTLPSKDTIEIVAAIIGLITSIIGFIKQLYEAIKAGCPISIKKFSCIVSLLLLISVIGFLWIKITAPNIIINIPVNYSEVNIVEDIRGECKNISLDKKIWIVVYSYSDNTYYPNHVAANIENNKKWSANAVSIGSSADRGKIFDIIPLLLDSSALATFQNYVNNHASRGLAVLPVGAKIFNKIEVKRR